jgi:methanogenic corrinoid protein MtbC1
MSDLKSASNLFESNYNNLIALVLKRMEVEMQSHARIDLRKLEPDLVEQFREFGELLRVIYRYELTDILPDEAAWYASALSSRGSVKDAFDLLVNSWIIAIQGIIKPPECNILARPLQEIINNINSIMSNAEHRRGSPPPNHIVKLVNYLINGDGISAQKQLLSYIDNGVKPYELITEFILPAMVEVGRRWENNEIQIFEEHLASETIIRLLAGFSNIFKPGENINRNALVSCVPNDKHQLVPMALSTFLELKGWRVISLGVSLPEEQILLATEKFNPDTIFLSLSMLSRLIEALELILKLQRNHPEMKIFIGGNGARSGKSLIEKTRAIVVQSFEEAHQLAIQGK